MMLPTWGKPTQHQN